MVGRRFERCVSAHAEAVGPLRRDVAAYAAGFGASEAAKEAVELAVGEALSNAVLHAYADQAPGEMIVEAWETDGDLVVLVCDEGRGMLPRVGSPGLGVGLSLIVRLADDVRIADRPDTPGTRVAMRFSLDGSGSGLTRSGERTSA
jgi:serine/threonine-protein kinase RsbW